MPLYSEISDVVRNLVHAPPTSVEDPYSFFPLRQYSTCFGEKRELVDRFPYHSREAGRRPRPFEFGSWIEVDSDATIVDADGLGGAVAIPQWSI